MRYRMKSGALYLQDDQTPLIRVTGKFSCPEKQITDPQGKLLLTVNIRNQPVPAGQSGGLHGREYTMHDGEAEIAVARPGYADSEDPTVTGWPVCRLPRVDHAVLHYGSEQYTLFMCNSQTYELLDAGQCSAVRIIQQGIMGGWSLETELPFSPVFLAGLYVFCRYIEKENEFLVV